MITGDIRSKVDRIWDTMWSGGISNPLSVIEQLTYLLFIKRLDELHTLKESKAARTGKPIEEPVFAADQQHLRWSRFKETAPETMFATVRDAVFPFIKSLARNGNGGDGDPDDSTYTRHMKDAIFMMPAPRVLANVVDQLDSIEMTDTDTKGDLYEYMLGKIASAGRNGQFRTPRHIIKLMVEMTTPTPRDMICDPACGTAGFLIAASEHLITHHSDAIYRDDTARRRFNEGTFHGYDFDSTMLRIGSMNMLLHGVENPDIRYRDSLAQTGDDEAEKYSLILANPPFAGSLDYASTAKDLQQIVKTKKTELLFMALFLRLLQSGGFILDDKRSSQPDKSDLPDILARWRHRDAEAQRQRTDKSFFVPKAEIAGNDYDLSINRYKEVEYEAVDYDPPLVILARLARLKEEIGEGRRELEGLLG